QLRATVSEGGIHSEPAKQMLNYIWGTGILLPEDIKTIMRLILTPSQQLLWQAYWQQQSDATCSPATKGSLGFDLVTAIDTTLITREPVKIPSTLTGPLQCNGGPCGALLLGRSSSAISGLSIVPGVIDADYIGVIQIVAYTLFPPVHVPKDSHIAQLVLPVPHLLADAAVEAPWRGNQGFGSSGGIVLLALPMNRRPMTVVTFSCQTDSIVLRALLDTGVDITIVSRDRWPRSWPLQPSVRGVEGVSGAS
ncbi:hypothetical protein N325_00486, partial [Colius striatus]